MTGKIDAETANYHRLMKLAREEGVAAARRGAPVDANPYIEGSDHSNAWDGGWRDAELEPDAPKPSAIEAAHEKHRRTVGELTHEQAAAILANAIRAALFAQAPDDSQDGRLMQLGMFLFHLCQVEPERRETMAAILDGVREGVTGIAPAQLPAWQGMETAPKGSVILMARPGIGRSPERMIWHDGGEHFAAGWYVADRRPREATWFVSKEHERHWRWMPMPAMPDA